MWGLEGAAAGDLRIPGKKKDAVYFCILNTLALLPRTTKEPKDKKLQEKGCSQQTADCEKGSTSD